MIDKIKMILKKLVEYSPIFEIRYSYFSDSSNFSLQIIY